MAIKAWLNQLAFRRGILTRKASSVQDINQFIHNFRNHYISLELIRIGGAGDGGYLIPDGVIDTVQYCFSPGVSDTANFEYELAANFGIQSFLADASVLTAPIVHDKIHFTRRFLGSDVSHRFMLLRDWMKSSIDDSEKDLLLQMDIEGSEYDVLINESEATLERFAVLVIEFHRLRDLFDESCLRMITSVFEKVYRKFDICHVHPNNCCGIIRLGGIEVPDVIEVTFVRRDLAAKLSDTNIISLPHRLDCRNVASKPEINMPDAWWKTDATAQA